MRIYPDGRRLQLSEPVEFEIPEDSSDELAMVQAVYEHRKKRINYMITKDDVGCTLKVKCRPVRSDGLKGEIFTSKPSQVIAESESGTIDIVAKEIKEEEEEEKEKVKRGKEEQEETEGTN